MKVGVSLRSAYAPMDVRTGARWLVERTRAASDADLDSLFIGDHHNVPVPYYQNVPMLGRLLAEWDDRPAGALFLLPLWHPVLLAEQIGTLASIAAGPFVMQCALGGGADQFEPLGVSLRTRPSRFEAVLDIVRRLCAGEEVSTETPFAIPRARIAPIPPHPLEVWIGGAADPAVDRAARLGDAFLIGPEATPTQVGELVNTYREACARHGRPATKIAVRRDVHVGADDADVRRVAGPILDAGYRGFDPAAPVVGGVEAVAAAFAELGSMGCTDVIIRHLADDQAEVLASFERLGAVRSTVADAERADQLTNPEAIEPSWVDTAKSLADMIDQLRDEPRYTLDTEFHGERTYWPRLALVQVAWPGHIALIDPFAVDMAPFAEILAGPGLLVAHAAEQDLAILVRACGHGPTKLFDTQVAAGFIGMGAPSLASLVERLLDVRLTKGDRLTDWTRRPLHVERRVYAAADVEFLLELHDILVARLEPMGRLNWATDECEERRLRIRTRPEPEVAWWRMKGARQLRGRSRGVAQQVAAWRERTAAQLDVPPRFVLSDLALIGIVSRPPHTREELTAIRGVDGRALRDGATEALLAAVTAGLALEPASVAMPESDHVDRALAPAVTVIGAWLAQRASELDLDPAVLATRADLTQLLHGAPSRIATGWRADLVGAPIQRLLAGEATIVLRDHGRRVELRDQ